MRKLLLIPLLSLMAGCVTYQYPVSETSGGVYYAEEEPAYAGPVHSDRAYVDYSIGYASTRYYPWWSLDYMYLGSGHYGSGFSIGVGFGYPSYYPVYDFGYYPNYYPARYYDPWFYSTPWLYSAWYAPVYHHHHYRAPYYNAYWHHRYRDYDRHDGRYAVYDPYEDPDGWRRNRDRDRMRDPDTGHDRPGAYDVGGEGRGDRYGSDSMARRMSMASSGTAGDRGMEVRNRADAKSRMSRTEPAASASAPVAVAGDTAAASRSVRARDQAYSTARRDAGQVRYRAEPKQKISRTEPAGSVTAPVTVTSGAAAGNSSMRARSNDYSVTRRDTGEVRYRAEPRQRSSRIEPVAARERQPSTSYRAGPLPRTGNSKPVVADTRRSGMTVRSPATTKSRQSRVQPVTPSAGKQASAPRVRMSSPAPRSASPQRSAAPPRAAPPRSAGRPASTPKVSAPRSTRSAERSSTRTGDRERHRE